MNKQIRGKLVPIFILFFGLLISAGKSYAQHYPVQCHVQVIPPYSVYLADYYQGANQKLLVNLSLKDLKRTDLSVRLKISIEGQGIKLITKNDFIPKRPILLMPGTPELVYGDLLEEYLVPEHLNFSGITMKQFLKTGRLPEGVYTFKVEVFEARRQEKVSNTATTMAWMILNEPPVITAPANNKLVKASDPASIFFNWLPRHMNSQNALSDVEYEFSLVEIWPVNQSAEEAIRSKEPLLKTTFRNTSFVYDAQYPILVPGRKYACRVRAFSNEQKEMFKNEGYSPVVSFVFGEECKPPLMVDVDPALGGSALLSIVPQRNHSAFTIQIRDVAGSKWYSQESHLPDFELKQLKPGATYQYKVQAQCETLESDFTPIKQFSLSKEQKEVECGQSTTVPEIDGSPALNDLSPGDVINAGGFKVLVKKASGGGGSFTGSGVVRIGMLGNIELRTVFENIKVNESYQLTGGEIRVVGSDIYALGGDIRDKSDDFFDDEIWDTIDDAIEDAEDIVDEISDLQKNFGDNNLNDELDEAREIIESGRDLLALDNPKGAELIKEGAAKVAQILDQVNSGDYKLTTTGIQFLAHDNQTYGFDSHEVGLSEEEKKAYLPYYETIQLGDTAKPYFLKPWKSIASNANDQVKVKIDLQGDMKADTVHFISSIGVEVAAQKQGDGFSLNLRGSFHEDVQQITAYYNVKDDSTKNTKKIILGALNVISYDQIEKHLVLVPVNGNDTSISQVQLKKYLNDAYKAANVNWTVSQHAGVQVQYNDDMSKGLDDGESGMLSNYTKEMNTVIKALKRSGDYDRHKTYMFLVDKAKTASKAGFMPKKRRWGFVFTDIHDKNAKALCRTIAHEVAHGEFRLSHPFQDFPSIPQKSTQNLMDYADGQQLRKYQWDDIHNLRDVKLWGQSEEGNASMAKVVCEKDGYFKNSEGYASFICPSGLPITVLPDGMVDIITSTVESEVQVASEGKKTYINTSLNIGTLLGFTENKIKYLAMFSPNKGNPFLGYYDTEGEKYKYDNQTIYYNSPYELNLIDAKGEFYTLLNQYYLPAGMVKNSYTGEGEIQAVGKRDFIFEYKDDLTEKEYEEFIANVSKSLGQNNFVSTVGYSDIDDDAQLIIDDLNDRFKVLQSVTGNKFYVDIVSLPGKPSDGQLKDLAKTIVEQSSLKDDAKLTYLVLPIWNVLKTNKALREVKRNAFAKSFYSNVSSYGAIDDLYEYDKLTGGVFNTIKSIYRLMPKPSTAFNYYLSYRGDLIIAKPIRKDEVVGREHIYELMIQYDNKIGLTLKGHIASTLSDEKNNWIAFKLLDQNADTASQLKYITADIAGLKESSLGLNLGEGDDIPTKFARWFAWHEFKIWAEAVELQDVGSPGNSHFIAGRNLLLHESNLNKIDAIGLALAPLDLDVLADIAGAVYCLLGADMDNAKIYGLGTVFPMVTGSSMKLGKTTIKEVVKGTKLMGKFDGAIKLWPKLNFDLFSKLRKVVPSWGDDALLELHDVINKYPNIAANFTDQYAELLVKVGQGRTQVLSQLDGWTEGALKSLSVDLKNAKFAEALVAKTELVESWKAARNLTDDIRRNTDDLEIISDYMKRSGKSADDVAGEIPSTVTDGKKWLGERKIEPFLDGSPNISSITAPPGYEIYQVQGRKYIRRLDATDSYTPRLMVDENGIVVKYTKPVRSNNQPAFINNLKAVYGDMPLNHQRHHLVSVNVVDNSAIHQEAIRRASYSVDRASNGRYLAETAADFSQDASGLSRNYPTHFGSHPKYDAELNKAINEYTNALKSKYGSIDKVPEDVLKQAVTTIENRAESILKGWEPSKLN